ncbi:MAG: DUF1289 domain-containing protein [Bacteroidia bacterium]
MSYVSPCISVCQINKETRTCTGCSRTIDQIRDWTKYSDDQRIAIIKELGSSKTS